MSWQAFVDQQILAIVPCKVALIAGIDDGTIWAQNEGSGVTVTPEELAAIGRSIKSNNATEFQESGIKLGGEKYICITFEPFLVRGRKNKNALCIVGTTSCLIVAVCDEKATPGQLNNAVEKLGDYLKANGY